MYFFLLYAWYIILVLFYAVYLNRKKEVNQKEYFSKMSIFLIQKEKKLMYNVGEILNLKKRLWIK